MAKERPVDLTVGDKLPLGSRIRLLRQARGVRLSTMAADLNYAKGYLSNVENNKVSPSDELVEKIADYLDISVDELRNAPIVQLMGRPSDQQSVPTAPFGLVQPALSVTMPVKRRTIGQRLERIIAMTHLSEEEQEIIEDYLVTLTSAALAFLKAARQSSSGD